MSEHQHAGQNNNIKTANKSFEIIERFGYLGTTLTNQNSINEEQIEVMDRLLSFGTESFVFQFALRKYTDQDIQNCNFICCFVRV